MQQYKKWFKKKFKISHDFYTSTPLFTPPVHIQVKFNKGSVHILPKLFPQNYNNAFVLSVFLLLLPCCKYLYSRDRINNLSCQAQDT